MNKINSMPMYQFFNLCDLTLNGLEAMANDISAMLNKTSLLEQDLNLLNEMIESYKILINKEKGPNYYASIEGNAQFCLIHLDNFLENSTCLQWIERKKASNYSKDIRQFYFLIKNGLQILRHIYQSELDKLSLETSSEQPQQVTT